MDRVERPLSPHLQVYRWQITNSLSILHRATGLVLSLGAVVLCYWLIALASGPAAYEQARAFFTAGWFKIPLIAWSFCFSYHLANGVRHLIWDLGKGFDPAEIRAGGWAVVTVSLLATGLFSVAAIF
jgi:succinate dehydrogenase / fumarate reductase cytochrome b subunit